MDTNKTYTLYTFIFVVIFFCFMWVVDAFRPDVSPAYQPFLTFLQIMKEIVSMVIT